jgi:hypothetical protein
MERRRRQISRLCADGLDQMLASAERWLERANLMADLRFFSLLQYLLLVVLNDRHCDLRYGSQAPFVNIDVNLRCLQSQARLITPPLGLVWSPGRVVDYSSLFVRVGMKKGDCWPPARYIQPTSTANDFSAWSNPCLGCA